MFKDEKMKFKLFANCIPVKGVMRSVICDLQRNRVEVIPNDLYQILVEYNGMSIETVKEAYNNEHDETIEEYFEFLSKNNYVFFSSSPEMYPDLPVDYNYPYLISNAIVDISSNTYDYKDAIQQISKIKCKNLQVRIFCAVDYSFIQSIILPLKVTNSIIQSIEIYAPYNSGVKKWATKDVFNKFPRIKAFYFYNSPKYEVTNPLNGNRFYFVYTQQEYLSEKDCGIISPDYFAINIQTFTESKNYNSCLNKKISIDKNGYIKNCPSFESHYGHISNTNLLDVINSPGFQKLWSIGKDKIETCNVCEFRHICTDCRAYISDPTNIYSKPLKCGYDPTTCTWEEWSKNPLKKEIIEYYKLNSI